MDGDVGVRVGNDRQMLGFVKHRLFEENYVVVFREAGQKVLRTLKHEIPPQVRQDDDGLHRISG
jgi:hypothetical protein